VTGVQVVCDRCAGVCDRCAGARVVVGAAREENNNSSLKIKYKYFTTFQLERFTKQYNMAPHIIHSDLQSTM
jgi:hypothetical protein